MPDNAHDQIVFYLNKAARAVASLYRPFIGTEITVPQYLALLVIHRNPAITVTELGDQMSVDSSTVTPMVQKLIKMGAVEKVRGIEDERVVRLYLTDGGLALANKHRGIWRRIEADLGLTEDELSVLRSVLRKIVDRDETR